MPKLLILASNPRRDLSLYREVSDLTDALQRFGKFELRFGFDASPEDLQRKISEHRPQIVHFCGHGAGEDGLVFQNEGGQEQLVSTETLARVFKIFANEINCAILNACESDRQAIAIAEHINYAIGMRQAILDEAAHCFTVGFYEGLATGSSIEQAYALGCLAIKIWEERSPHSTRSRQYRKLEYVGGTLEPVDPPLAEDIKPVLRTKSSLSTSNLTLPVPSLSLSPSRQQEFTEFIKQEIDRKDYKVQARAAYENFGLYSAQNTSENGVQLTIAEHKQRQILLDKVKQFWIEGFLKPSLLNFPDLRLDLKARPDAIADLLVGFEALSVELDPSYDKLRPTQIYQEIGQGRTLLMLGEPGAGKTIALLQLAQRLIKRSEQNLSLPIPVVFNLSSWARERKAFVNWIIDELREKYQVPKALSEPWILQQQLIFLLDGLDEVKEEHRNDCVRALNDFIELFPQTEVAVCSRGKDYEALTERLQISSALCLQPLSSEQVYLALDKVGGPLAGLKMLLKNDVELEKFAQTPLILNFMSVAYQGWSVEKLMQELRSTSNRSQHLFDTYIYRRLDRGATSEYSKDKVLRWLSWLASQMVREKQTIFLIEKLQPVWLQNRNEQSVFRIITILFPGLILGLISILIGWQIVALIIRQTGWPLVYMIGFLSAWPIGGLALGLIFGLFFSRNKEITPFEKIKWSWHRTKLRLIPEFFTGFSSSLSASLIGGLLGGLVAAFMTVLITDPIPWLTRLIDATILGFFYGLTSGLTVGLIFGLGSGLGNTKIEKRVTPNQGIWNSLRNSVVIAMVAGLISGAIYKLIYEPIFRLIWALLFRPNEMIPKGYHEYLTWPIVGMIGLMFGLIAGLKYGGVASVQHFTLRRMLYKKGRIPWNYAKFLDFASDRLLMKKIGGGYVFYHRMLLEHFAQMWQNKLEKV
jgi:MFS family permease